MSASGFTPISLYYSTTAAAVPVNTNLANGELAINIIDGKLYYKDNAGAVQVLATKNTAEGIFTSITDSGNLTFTGTGNRITGDFSNATAANNVAFQTNTTNGGTGVYVIPNGTSTTAGITFSNSSSPDNSSLALFRITSTDMRLVSGAIGTGTLLPLTMFTGGSERLRITTNGGVSFGSSGTAYGTSGQILQSNGDAAPTWATLSSMVYPGAGIPNSTGTAWGTSYTTTGTGSVVALASNPTLTGFTETVFAVTGTTPALSPNNGTIQTYALTGNSTSTFGTWDSGQSLTLMVSQNPIMQGFRTQSQVDVNSANMGVGFKLVGATAFDPAAFTYNAVSTTADSYAAASVALRPASGKSIGFVGGTTASTVGTALAWTASLTGLTGGIASAPAENDIVVVYYGVSSLSDVSMSIVGFTELIDLYANDTYDANLGVYYKIMTSTPDTSITLNATGGNDNAGTAVIFVFRNVNTTTPIDVATTSTTAINGLLINPPSITPVTSGAVVVFGGIGAEAGTGTYSTSDINIYAITFPEIIWSGASVPSLVENGYTAFKLWKVNADVYGTLVGNFQ